MASESARPFVPPPKAKKSRELGGRECDGADQWYRALWSVAQNVRTGSIIHSL